MDMRDYDKLWQRPEGLPLTGYGTTIAIIDQPLWLAHPEYMDRIARYNSASTQTNSFHGPAVTSIAVGGDIGIAPGARVVYEAFEPWQTERCLLNHAEALRNIYELAKSGHRIDCVSTSHNLVADIHGVEENHELVRQLAAMNIPVFSADSLLQNYAFCGPEGLCAKYNQLVGDLPTEGKVFIPIDSRPLAHWKIDEVGQNMIRRPVGGSSWAVPFIAGMFAMAREAEPGITESAFTELVKQSAVKRSFNEQTNLNVVDLAGFCRAVDQRARPGPSRSAPPAAHP